MKIFLQDRTIEFRETPPETTLPGDIMLPYNGPDSLSEAWSRFLRYEKYQRLLIISPFQQDDPDQDTPPVMAFRSLFRVVQAAGGLVVNEHGDYLFIHRFGKWDLPKGKISRKDGMEGRQPADEKSTAQRAALREVREETGLKKLELIREIMPTWHIYTEKESWYLKQTRWFAMEASSDQALKPQTAEGIFLVRWFPKKELHCVMGKTYASVRELLLETLF